MADHNQRIHPRVTAVVQGADRGIMERFGMSVTLAMDGACEIVAVVPQDLVNASGFAHGGFAFSIMDTASAYALSSTEVRGVTISANTTYVKGAAAGSRLYGRVEIASRTRRVATLRGEVYLESKGGRELAAHGTFVFHLIEVKT